MEVGESGRSCGHKSKRTSDHICSGDHLKDLVFTLREMGTIADFKEGNDRI